MRKIVRNDQDATFRLKRHVCVLRTSTRVMRVNILYSVSSFFGPYIGERTCLFG
jgi:hypothetical protein